MWDLIVSVPVHCLSFYFTWYKPLLVHKISNEVLNKLKSTGFKASTLSTYEFYTLYTTLPYHFIKDKLIDVIEHTFSREKVLYLVCKD